MKFSYYLNIQRESQKALFEYRYLMYITAKKLLLNTCLYNINIQVISDHLTFTNGAYKSVSQILILKFSNSDLNRKLIIILRFALRMH